MNEEDEKMENQIMSTTGQEYVILSCRELGVGRLTKQGTARTAGSKSGFEADLNHRSSHAACGMSHLALSLSTVLLFLFIFFLPNFLASDCVASWITIADEMNQHRDI